MDGDCCSCRAIMPNKFDGFMSEADRPNELRECYNPRINRHTARSLALSPQFRVSEQNIKPVRVMSLTQTHFFLCRYLQQRGGVSRTMAHHDLDLRAAAISGRRFPACADGSDWISPSARHPSVRRLDITRDLHRDAHKHHSKRKHGRLNS